MVAGVREILREQRVAQRHAERDVGADHRRLRAQAMRVSAGQQGGSSGGADGLHVVVLELDALGGERVDAGRERRGIVVPYLGVPLVAARWYRGREEQGVSPRKALNQARGLLATHSATIIKMFGFDVSPATGPAPAAAPARAMTASIREACRSNILRGAIGPYELQLRYP